MTDNKSVLGIIEDPDNSSVSVVYPRKGDPIYDIRGFLEYCKEHKLAPLNAQTILKEQFVMGYH